MKLKKKAFNLPNKKGLSIDSIYLMLSKGKRIQYKELPGQFVYLRSDTVKGEYEARFISNFRLLNQLIHVSYAVN